MSYLLFWGMFTAAVSVDWAGILELSGGRLGPFLGSSRGPGSEYGLHMYVK
jgi:hypothetical protein